MQMRILLKHLKMAILSINMKNKDTQDLLDLASELRWEVGENFHDTLVEGIYADAAHIAQKDRN